MTTTQDFQISTQDFQNLPLAFANRDMIEWQCKNTNNLKSLARHVQSNDEIVEKDNCSDYLRFVDAILHTSDIVSGHRTVCQRTQQFYRAPNPISVNQRRHFFRQLRRNTSLRWHPHRSPHRAAQGDRPAHN